MAVSAGALLLALACTTCGGKETVMVELSGDSSCTESLLEDLHAVRAELREPAARRTECKALTGTVETIGDLQAQLAGLLAFAEVEEGSKSVAVFGYLTTSCEGDDIILCGKASFELPGSDTIKLEVSCYKGSSPPGAFKKCAGL